MTPPLTAESLVAWDTETHLIAPGVPAPPLVCATEGRAGSTAIYLRAGLGAGDAFARFRELLADPTLHIGGANLVYDLGVHASQDEALDLTYAALDAGRLHSTDILEALHDNARGCIYREANGTPIGRYSLEFLEARYLGIHRAEEKHGEDAWRLRYHELDGVPLAQWPQEAVDYPLHDARGTYDVLAIQLGLVPGHWSHPRANLQCEADEMQAAWALHLSRCYGMRTDPAMVAQATADMRAEHESSRRKFFASGIVRLRPATRDETPDAIPLEWVAAARATIDATAGAWQARRLKDLVAAERALGRGKGLKWATDTARLAELVTAAYQGAPPSTDTGRVSTARDTLVESGDELLEEFGEAGPNEKMLSTYASVLEQGTSVPINPGVNSLVASGRTSYSKPNLQNLPQAGAVRYSFVPRAGAVYCSVDYSALELCTLAQVTYSWFGASAMRDAINARQDLHLRLAARIGGITYEEAQARRKAHDKAINNLRKLAKPINFGLPGLMGAAKLVLTARKQGVRFCELSGRSHRCADNPRVTEWKRRTISPTCSVCLELAVEYARLWREEWPEVAQYLEVTPQIAESGEPAPSFGNGMLRLDPSAGAISNHFFQNLAAQGAKLALVRLTRECLTDRKSVLYRAARPVVFVHDEIITELREDVAHECAERQAEVMIAAMRELVPDVRISAVPALARRWFKSMEDVRSADGRLRPWWPPDGVSAKPGESTEAHRARALREWTWAPDQVTMRQDLGW